MPCRAERFNTTYKEPARHRTDLIMDAKRERLRREGFKTGFDFFSEVSLALLNACKPMRACNHPPHHATFRAPANHHGGAYAFTCFTTRPSLAVVLFGWGNAAAPAQPCGRS